MGRRVVAVTGGVASGKSEACRHFQALGLPVVDADEAARAVVAPGQPALAAVAAAFGPGSLAADGSLDRAAMRARVFADPGARRRLEALLHPPIRDWLSAAVRALPDPVVLVAIPLLAEGGGRAAYPWLDRVLVVDAPPAVQEARLMARDRADQALARRMIAAQASRGERLALASDVVVNDGPLAALHGAVARLAARYAAMAAAPGTGPA